MPATRKRIRPIIEEIIEPNPEKIIVEQKNDSETQHKHVIVEEEAPVETQHQVASYDEPPILESVSPVTLPKNQAPSNTEHVEAAARALLSSDAPVRRRGTNMKLVFVVTIITALIVGFIAGGVYVYVSGVSNSKNEEDIPTPTPGVITQQTSTPKPSPTPTPNPGVYKVSVLNGSGVIGAAGKVKAAIEDSGFKVSGTGNASNYNFKNTVIQVKDSVPAQALDLLKKSLKDYVVEDGNVLPASSTFDIVVTAGKE